MKHTHGWTPDLPDHRDHVLTVERATKAPLKVDLRALCPPVLDQGELGSCTANAIANAHRFDQNKQKKAAVFSPSRLFIYYNERAMEGTVKSDAGAQIRDGIKSIAKSGVCTEAEWPYTIKKFATRPPAKCFADATAHQAVNYQRVPQTVEGIRSCLSAGFPFVFGFSVYEAFESDQVAATGLVNLPRKGEQLLGGHAVLCVGCDDTTDRILVMNSWGTAWGQHGYFTMPYDYVLDNNLADDLWTVQGVE